MAGHRAVPVERQGRNNITGGRQSKLQPYLQCFILLFREELVIQILQNNHWFLKLKQERFKTSGIAIQFKKEKKYRSWKLIKIKAEITDLGNDNNS